MVQMQPNKNTFIRFEKALSLRFLLDRKKTSQATPGIKPRKG